MDEYFTAPDVVAAHLGNRDKVRLALFKLKGKAEQWRDAQLRGYTAEGATWPTWAEFVTTFKTKWGEPNQSAKALRELKNYIYKTHKKDPLRTILTTVDTLIQDAQIVDEEQKISFL